MCGGGGCNTSSVFRYTSLDMDFNLEGIPYMYTGLVLGGRMVWDCSRIRL